MADAAQPSKPALTCKNLDLQLSSLEKDEIPPQVPTGVARLPAWHDKATVVQDVIREGRPLQVQRWTKLTGELPGRHAFVADPAGKRVREVALDTLAVVADYPLPSGPAQLVVDARPVWTGGRPVVWATLPDSDQLARIETGPKPTIALQVSSGRPTALALAESAKPGSSAHPELLVLGHATPPALSFRTLEGLELHRAALPDRPVAVRGANAKGALVTLATAPPVFVGVGWKPQDDGAPKSSQYAVAPLRSLTPAQLMATARGQVMPAMTATQAHAATCQGNRCWIAHMLAATGGNTQQPVTPTYGPNQTTTLAPCSRLPVRPLTFTVSVLQGGFSQMGPMAAVAPAKQIAADPVRDPASDREWLGQFFRPTDVLRLASTDVLAVAAAGSGKIALLTDLDDPAAVPLGQVVLQSEVSAIAELPSQAGQPAMLVALDRRGTRLVRIPLTPLRDQVQQHGAYAQLPAPLVLLPDASLEISTDGVPTALTRGRQLFDDHGAAAGLARADRLVCADCHVAGGSDGLVWSSPHGLRNTPALAGRVAGGAPFGWGGEAQNLRDHLTKTVERLGGTGLSEPDLAALQAWLEAMPPPATAKLTWPVAAARGQKVFHSPTALCASCHPPPAWQDGLVHEVAGKSLNTPSLVGLATSAPYLHDGAAPTLDELLVKHAKWMGGVQALTAGQRSDLVAYLLTL